MIPPEEIAARLARVRASMATGEIDALVVLAPDSQYWLCGLESFISGVLSQALLVPTEGGTTLVMWDADEPLARETARVDRIRGYRFGVDDPGGGVRRRPPVRCRDRRLRPGSRAVPHAVGVRLVEALAPARCADCTALLADARLLKSEYELDCLSRAGAFAETGLGAALEHARRGVTERELATEIEYAMRRAPARTTRRSRPSSPPGAALTLSTAHPPTAPWSPVISSTSRSAGSSSATTPSGCRHSRSAAPNRRRGARALRGRPRLPPGGTRHRPAGSRGPRGRGAGPRDPPRRRARRRRQDEVRLRRRRRLSADVARRVADHANLPQQLQPGVAFVLHPCLLDEDARVGVVAGGTYAVSATGVQQLAGAGAVDLCTT